MVHSFLQLALDKNHFISVDTLTHSGDYIEGEALVCMYKHACSRASHQNDNNPTNDSLSISGTWHHPRLELGVQASKAEYVCINGVVIFVWLIVLRAQ